MRDHEVERMESVGLFIRAQRRQARLSLRQLSDRSGISNPYLSQIERGLRRPSADILHEIARALELPVEELYVRAGVLEPAADGDLVAHIWRDPVLDDSQKHELARVYREFRDQAAADQAAVGKAPAVTDSDAANSGPPN